MKQHPFFEILIIAAMGAAVAVSIDFAISMDGSLVHGATGYLDDVANQLSSIPISFHFVSASLVLFGALSVYYLRPLTRKGAFACGFAAIAMLAIFVP